MNKFAEQFQNDILIRYQQKMAELSDEVESEITEPNITIRFDDDENFEGEDGDTVRLDLSDADKPDPRHMYDPARHYLTPKADAMAKLIPETTLFERISNSAPVSGMLDAYDATIDTIANSPEIISRLLSNAGNKALDFGSKMYDAGSRLYDLGSDTYEGLRDSIREGIPNIKGYMPGLMDLKDAFTNEESQYRVSPLIAANEFAYRFGRPFVHRRIGQTIESPLDQDAAKLKFMKDYYSNEAALKALYMGLSASNTVKRGANTVRGYLNNKSDEVKNSLKNSRLMDYINYYTK